MAVTEPNLDAPPTRRGRLPLLIGVAGALLAGAGGYYTTYSGLVPLPAATSEPVIPDAPKVSFVALDPVTVSLPPGGRARHLRLSAQIEVEPAQAAAVIELAPRFLDVINGYLRAIDLAQVEDPAALVRIRAHLLHRLQLVAGEGRVRDLLITEFLLN